jgi:hypothetical protein
MDCPLSCSVLLADRAGRNATLPKPAPFSLRRRAQRLGPGLAGTTYAQPEPTLEFFER